VRENLIHSKKIYPGNDEFHNGKYTDAIATYTEAIKLDPSNKMMNSILYSNRALGKMVFSLLIPKKP